MRIEALSGWTSEQKHVVAASFLGWTLDAFDFFLLVFVLKDIAQEFDTQITDVTFAILLTLAMRPIGAYLFGRAADRLGPPADLDGRRPALLRSSNSPRALRRASPCCWCCARIFGIAMGGEWGVGASLTMESIPPQARGFVSGLLQSGYPAGYFLASIVYGLLFQYIGWRGMFMVGVIPALLVFYIRRKVPESPSLAKPATAAAIRLAIVKSHWRLGIYAVLLMTAFNFFSHGTQDLYPTFLQVQHKMSPHEVGLIAVIYNIGAIIGGMSFGSLSERFGRRRIIIIAALLSLAVLPLWAFAASRRLARRRRLPDAGDGARRLGRDPGPSERIVARRCARHFPGLRLSARQSHRLGQCHAASRHRRPLRRQLRALRSPLSPARSRS